MTDTLKLFEFNASVSSEIKSVSKCGRWFEGYRLAIWKNISLPLSVLYYSLFSTVATVCTKSPLLSWAGCGDPLEFTEVFCNSWNSYSVTASVLWWSVIEADISELQSEGVHLLKKLYDQSGSQVCAWVNCSLIKILCRHLQDAGTGHRNVPVICHKTALLPKEVLPRLVLWQHLRNCPTSPVLSGTEPEFKWFVLLPGVKCSSLMYQNCNVIGTCNQVHGVAVVPPGTTEWQNSHHLPLPRHVINLSKVLASSSSLRWRQLKKTLR